MLYASTLEIGRGGKARERKWEREEEVRRLRGEGVEGEAEQAESKEGSDFVGGQCYSSVETKGSEPGAALSK